MNAKQTDQFVAAHPELRQVISGTTMTTREQIRFQAAAQVFGRGGAFDEAMTAADHAELQAMDARRTEDAR